MSAAKTSMMDPQQQLDTRAIEIAAGTAGKVENMERLIELQIGHLGEGLAAQGKALEKQGETIVANHKEVLAAISKQANVEAGKRASLYGLKDKLGGLVIAGLGGTVITLAIYIWQHGVH